MLKVIRDLLVQIVNNIDTGNSNMTDEEMRELTYILEKINNPYMSKYQACDFLNIKRSRFDELVREGKIPKGNKVSGFKELFWKKADLLKYIANNK